MAEVLLTCAQQTPSNCPQKEAVMVVCKQRKEEAERNEECDEGQDQVTSTLMLWSEISTQSAGSKFSA